MANGILGKRALCVFGPELIWALLRLDLMEARGHFRRTRQLDLVLYFSIRSSFADSFTAAGFDGVSSTDLFGSFNSFQGLSGDDTITGR